MHCTLKLLQTTLIPTMHKLSWVGLSPALWAGLASGKALQKVRFRFGSPYSKHLISNWSLCAMHTGDKLAGLCTTATLASL